MYLVYIGTWYILFQMIANFKSNFVISEPQPCGHRAFKIVVNFICIYPSSYLAVSYQLQPVAMVWLPVYWLLAGSGYWLLAGSGYWLVASGWNPVVPDGWLAGTEKNDISPGTISAPVTVWEDSYSRKCGGEDRTGQELILATVMVWEDRDSRTHEEGGTVHGIL